MSDRLRCNRFAAHDPLVGSDRRDRACRRVGGQVGPRVCGSPHLGHRADRETRGVLDEHRSRVRSRRLEREAILGPTRRGPQLPAPLECSPRPVAELDEQIPFARVAQRVDQTDELVEVAGFDGVDNAVTHGLPASDDALARLDARPEVGGEAGAVERGVAETRPGRAARAS